MMLCLQEGLELLHQNSLPIFKDALSGPYDCSPQPIVIKRLQYVVHGVQLERGGSIFVIGNDKDYGRHALRADPVHDIQPQCSPAFAHPAVQGPGPLREWFQSRLPWATAKERKWKIPDPDGTTAV